MQVQWSQMFISRISTEARLLHLFSYNQDYCTFFIRGKEVTTEGISLNSTQLSDALSPAHTQLSEQETPQETLHPRLLCRSTSTSFRGRGLGHIGKGQCQGLVHRRAQDVYLSVALSDARTSHMLGPHLINWCSSAAPNPAAA